MKIHCGHCGYEWETKSTAKRISCSMCKTSIRINPRAIAQSTAPMANLETVSMPLPLAQQLNKFMLARMIGIANSNGDASIMFKINEQGELYVPS